MSKKDDKIHNLPIRCDGVADKGIQRLGEGLKKATSLSSIHVNFGQ